MNSLFANLANQNQKIQHQNQNNRRNSKKQQINLTPSQIKHHRHIRNSEKIQRKSQSYNNAINEQHKQDLQKLNVLRYQDFQTIKLDNKKQMYKQLDQDFINDVKAIASIKQDIFSNLMQYRKIKKQITDQQCDQIDFKARIHWKSNLVNTNSSSDFNYLDSSTRCQCGCQRGCGVQYSLCTDQQTLHFLGPGVVLHFMYIKMMFWLLIIISLIYGIFALSSNLIGDNADTSQCSGNYCIFQKITSNQNKFNSSFTLVVQKWLGLIICVIWLIAVRMIKYFGNQKNIQIDHGLTSASDYAVKISNLPNGCFSQEEIIQYLNKLHSKIEQQDQNYDNNNGTSQDSNIQANKFKLKSIQIIYNMQFSRKMTEDIFNQSLNVYQLLQENQIGKKNLISDINLYKLSKNKLKQSYQLLQDLRKKFLNDTQFRKSISSTCCLIQFHCSEDKDKLLKHFGSKKIGIIKSIQEKIKRLICCNQKGIIFKGKILKMQRAPQPSDILWQNCQKSYNIFRIAIIYGATFLIVSIGFGIYQVLDFLQERLAQNEDQGSLILIIISLVMAVFLQIINKIIWFSMFYLLELQYNHTLTDKIISQMNKTLFSTSVNNIVLPIVSSYFIRNKIYGANSVNGQSFDFQIIFLVVAIVTAIDPVNILKRLILWIRKIRNGVIQWYCAKLSNIKPQKGVDEINTLYEGSYFNIAENYVNLMGAIYHAVFFCQLQPFVLFLVIVMCGIFYIGNKFRLLRTCKIPQLTDYLVFQNALSQANVVPIMHGIGTILLTYIQSQHNPNLPVLYYPSIIAIGLTIFVIGNPGDIFNKLITWGIKKCSSDKNTSQQEHHSAIDFLKGQQQNFKRQTKQYNNVNRKKQKKKTFIASTKCNDTYYQDSNSLTLLGFEAALRGKSVKTIMNQLENYCESFFRDFNNAIQAKNALLAIFSNPSNPIKKLNKQTQKQIEQQNKKQKYDDISQTKSKIIQLSNQNLAILNFPKIQANVPCSNQIYIKKSSTNHKIENN